MEESKIKTAEEIEESYDEAYIEQLEDAFKIVNKQKAELEARNKELESALQKIVNVTNEEGNSYSKQWSKMLEIAEQVLKTFNCPSCGANWDTGKHNSCSCGANISRTSTK